MFGLLSIIHIFVLLTLATLLYRREHALRTFYWPALATRLLGGVCLGLVYTYYYSVADTFVYFSDGAKLAKLARSDWRAYAEVVFLNVGLDDIGLRMTEPRALFLSKMTSFFNLATSDNYWVTGAYFSFISFVSAWYLVRVISRNIPSSRNAALIGFIFLPSVAFWTGGLLKEAPAMGALWFLSALVLKQWFRKKTRWWEFLTGLFALWVFWNLKYYYAGIWMAVVCTTFLCQPLFRHNTFRRPGIEAITWTGLFILPIAVISFWHPNFHFDRLLGVIAQNNAAYNALSAPDGYVHFYDLAPAPGSFMLNAPWALFSGLFRPGFWDVSSAIQLFPGLENTFLLIVFAGSLTRIKAYSASPHRLLILGLVAFVVSSCVLITLSAPNFGTLSRYRTGYISFFTYIILCNNPILQYVERSVARLVSQLRRVYL